MVLFLVSMSNQFMLKSDVFLVQERCPQGVANHNLINTKYALFVNKNGNTGISCQGHANGLVSKLIHYTSQSCQTEESVYSKQWCCCIPVVNESYMTVLKL